MEASLCTRCVFDVFGVRVLFDMDTNHVFPQGVLWPAPQLLE